LTAGLFWKRATNQGALVAIFCGLSVWLGMLIAGPDDPFIPAQLAGLIASILGMLTGSLLPCVLAKPVMERPEHAVLHHHAASHTGHVADGRKNL